METVSQKRGRPQKFDPAWVKVVGGIFSNLTSNRQRVAKCYEIKALGAVRVSAGVLAEGVENIVTASSTNYKATILEHLGRLKMAYTIDDEYVVTDADILAAARWLSSRFDSDPQFTVRKAVALLRELREEVGARLYLGCDVCPMERLLQMLADDQ